MDCIYVEKTKGLISCVGYRTADLPLCFCICKKYVLLTWLTVEIIVGNPLQALHINGMLVGEGAGSA